MYILRGLQSGLRSASGGSSRAYVVGGSGVRTQADAIQAKGVRVGELGRSQLLCRCLSPADPSTAGENPDRVGRSVGEKVGWGGKDET